MSTYCGWNPPSFSTLSDSNKNILIVHGTSDTIVPFEVTIYILTSTNSHLIHTLYDYISL